VAAGSAKSSLLSKFPLPLVILIVGGLAVAAVATMKPKPEAKEKEEAKPPEVSIVMAQAATHRLSVRTQGTVTPRREISLVSEASGRIVKVNPNFIDGGFVAAGETLIEIDPRDYQYALVQAESQVAEAQQRLATERGQARQKKREWRNLGNNEANDLFLRKPQIAAAEANLGAAKANRDKAKLNLERTKIRLPFDGRIRSSKVDLGQFVSPGAVVAQAYDTAVAEIRLPLTDSEAALLDLPLGFSDVSDHTPAVTIIATIAGEQYQWQGRIKRTDASIDTRSRLYYAVAEVTNPFDSTSGQAPLMVGLFVEAEIEGRELSNVIELPKTAVFKRDQIFVVGADKKLIQKTVRVMKNNAERVWIRAELDVDAQIVNNNQQFLAVGVKVDPKLGSSPSPVKENKTLSAEAEVETKVETEADAAKTPDAQAQVAELSEDSASNTASGE